MTPPVPSVLALLPQFNACAVWRVSWPFRALQRRNVRCNWMDMNHERVPEVAVNHDVLVYQRVAWLDLRVGREAIAGAHRAGKLVFQEADDDMWLHRGEQKSHEELGIEERMPTCEENIASTKLYDGVIVSTEALRTVVEQVAPEVPVEVVPNAIDLDYWGAACQGWEPTTRIARDAGKVTVGWFGGDRYDRDVESMAEGWRLAAAQDENLHFVVMGHQVPALVNAVPEDRLSSISWLPIEHDSDKPFYGVGLKEMDIGCAAVAETEFNRAKTPIKLWEYTASGAAVIGTPWLYGQHILDGKDGYVAKTPREWARAIVKLAKARGRRADFAREHLLKVKRHHTVEQNAWRHVAAWQSLIEQAAPRAFVLLPEGSA